MGSICKHIHRCVKCIMNCTHDFSLGFASALYYCSFHSGPHRRFPVQMLVDTLRLRKSTFSVWWEVVPAWLLGRPRVIALGFVGGTIQQDGSGSTYHITAGYRLSEAAIEVKSPFNKLNRYNILPTWSSLVM